MMSTTADYLNELKNQKSLLAAKLAAEGTGATSEDTFNELVSQAQELHGTDQTYNPNSSKAQSGKAVAEAIRDLNIDDLDLTIDQTYNSKSSNAQSGVAVAEGIDNSVGEINQALSSLVEPSEIDPETWMNEAVDAAVEDINAQNEVTIASEVEKAISKLSTENEETLKRQVLLATDELDAKVKRAFITSTKTVTDGNILFEPNTIYAIGKTPAENVLTVYDPTTLEPITISDRHYGILVGNESDEIEGAVCATVISYPSLELQLYLVKNADLQASITWTGTAIMAVVKNELLT